MSTRILIVEDEGMIALELKQRLERAGYLVPAIADNGDDAIQSVASVKPDLVLMDIRLRGALDGIETAHELRRRFRVPVMFVTAHADRDTLERAKITEPFGYVVKPFHSVDFRAQIEIALWKHQMEHKLRVSEAWLSATCHNVAEALIATDSEGNIAFMNALASKLTGWDWQEAKGQPMLEVFQAFDEATGLPMVHPLETIYDGGRLPPRPRDFHLLPRAEDESVLIEARFSVNRDEEALLGIIAVFSDVRERRRAEEEQRRSQKLHAVTGMASGLGRDLERSQSKMNFALERLAAEARPKSRIAMLLADVQKHAAEQQDMVRQLIRLGRTEVPHGVAVNLNAMIDGMRKKLTRALGIDRVLELKLEEGLPAIAADPRDMSETLLRLVANAKNATPDGGVAEISTESVEVDGRASVLLTVRDNGKIFVDSSGLGAALLGTTRDRAFDPYFESRRGTDAAGIALALVYQFVASCGGTIEVSSRPGEGTAYLLYLPVAETAAPDRRAASA